MREREIKVVVEVGRWLRALEPGPLSLCGRVKLRKLLRVYFRRRWTGEEACRAEADGTLMTALL